MADVHRIKGVPSHVDIELVSLSISEVAGALGLMAMMATKVDDDEMVVDPRDFYGMMEGLRGQLVRARKQLSPLE